MIGNCILAVLVLILCVVLIRTVRFRPIAEPNVAPVPVELDEEKIVRDMQDLIRCKTVSHSDDQDTDWKEFEKLQNLLAERFPLVHNACTLRKIGKTGLLYHLPGEASDALAKRLLDLSVLYGRAEQPRK